MCTVILNCNAIHTIFFKFLLVKITVMNEFWYTVANLVFDAIFGGTFVRMR